MTKIFLDTAELEDIRTWAPTGLINGVTTNPSLIYKADRPFRSVIKEICDIVPGPVSVEVTTSTYEEMLVEGIDFSKIAPNVIVKLPLTVEGLRVCRRLSMDGIHTNVTLCFTAAQALLSAKAGATFVSPFIGRLDDIGKNGLLLLEDITAVFRHYPLLTTEILAASIRHLNHVVEAAKRGVQAVTVPPKIFKQLYEHPLTDKGLAQFSEDWAKVQSKNHA